MSTRDGENEGLPAGLCIYEFIHKLCRRSLTVLIASASDSLLHYDECS